MKHQNLFISGASRGIGLTAARNIIQIAEVHDGTRARPGSDRSDAHENPCG